jgi:crossover junction endodeoxyribonuclease RusA
LPRRNDPAIVGQFDFDGVLMDTVVLDWPPKELNPNSRKCYHVKAKKGKDYKHDVYYLCKEAGLTNPGGNKVHLSLNFYPPSRHAFDTDNCIAMMKWGQDSIAEYLSMNDKNFIPHYFYHGFQEDFKGKVVVKITGEPDL